MAQSPREEDVLRDIFLNVDVPGASEEDADLALAKALQEQERAFLRLQGPREGAENFFREDRSGALVLHNDGGEGADPCAGGASEAAGSGLEEGLGAEEDDDLALAVRMQQEEHEAHLRELAGIRSDEEGDGAEEEDYFTDDALDPDNMTFEELQALGDAVGTVSRGVASAIMQALPRRKYGSHHRHHHQHHSGDAAAESAADKEPDQCTVCQMELEDGENILLLPCSHFYHPNCILQWLNINKVCPICSKEVTAEAVKLQDRLTAKATKQAATIVLSDDEAPKH